MKLYSYPQNFSTPMRVERKLSNAVCVAMLYAILLFAVGWCVWAMCVPLLGDDLVAAFRYRDYDGAVSAPLRYAWGVWNHANARTGDMLAPLWLYQVSRFITALMLGVGVFFSLWGMLRLAAIGRRTPLSGVAMLVLAFVVLPWWDMDFFVCHFNYVWGTALLLPILFPLVSGRAVSYVWLWLLPLVFVATATHEALALPIGCGLLLSGVINRGKQQWNLTQKLWVGVMLAAMLFAVSSPASYRRVGMGGEPDLPIWGLLVQTLPLTLLLAVRVVWLAAHQSLSRLLSTRWTMFATAAIVSACFTLLGGIEGRGGWYSQVFALIALGFDIRRLEIKKMGKLPLWLYRVALVPAIGCSLYAIGWGLHLMEQVSERKMAVAMYRLDPESVYTKMAVDELENSWVSETMPLVRFEPVNSPNFSYQPSVPPHQGEINPTDPLL